MPNNIQQRKMDTENETNSYLEYLNDADGEQSYLLTSNEVGLNDSFNAEPIFTEIETSVWQTVLLNNTLITEDCDNVETTETLQLYADSPNNDEVFEVNSNVAEEMEIQITEVEDLVQNKSQAKLQSLLNDNQKTYVNYAPIVNEKTDGVRDIFLTEKDVNDATIIQLFNTDGTVITLDKSILDSINKPVKQKMKDVEKFCTEVTATQCKLCEFLCVDLDEMRKHLIGKHPSQFVVNNVKVPNGKNKNGMISVLNKDKINGITTKKNEYTMFVCSICKDVCFDKDTLKQHLLQEHNCITENKTDSSKETESDKALSSLKCLSSFLIQKQQKALKKVRCPVQNCSLAFPDEDVLEKHKTCHSAENKKYFKCFECDKIFSVWRICKNHLWKEHKIDMGLLVCPMCNKFKSISSAMVLNHMTTHNEEKPFACPLCEKTFKNLSQMKNHCVLHKDPNYMPPWSTLKKCDTCQRFFANSKTLKKHIQSVHENFKPFICNICGHKTSRKQMLQLHLRQHTGVKPHECPYCDYRTGDHNCLRKHIMLHTGAHKYQCQYCPYTCIQSSGFKSHMRHKHPNKGGTFKCRYCTYSSINEAAFIAHEKCHEVTINNEISPREIVLATTAPRPVSPDNSEQVDNPDEDENCFLNAADTINEETVIYAGGITIPAGVAIQPVS